MIPYLFEGDMETFMGLFFALFIGAEQGGVELKFWTFDGREGTNKIKNLEQERKFGYFLITQQLNAPMKRCLLSGKSRDLSKFSASALS